MLRGVGRGRGQYSKGMYETELSKPCHNSRARRVAVSIASIGRMSLYLSQMKPTREQKILQMPSNELVYIYLLLFDLVLLF